jgi:hypothetical protein
MRTKASEASVAHLASSKAQTCGPADRGPRFGTQVASTWNPSSWPISPDDVAPLVFWRTIPANNLGQVPHLMLRETLDKICVMQGRQWLSAMRGDPAASIAIAVEAMPIIQITSAADLAMTTLALCALDGNAGAALVLAHILHRTQLEHPFADELSISWLALNLHRASTRRNNSSWRAPTQKLYSRQALRHSLLTEGCARED